MNSIRVGEFRSRIAVGDRYLRKPGSSHYWNEATVRAITPDTVTYTYLYPHSESQASGTNQLSPSDFARFFLWDYCAEKIA